MINRNTPTCISLTMDPMYLPRDPFSGCPELWGLVNDSAASSRPRAIQIGDGILTQRSREEVARITERLGGKARP